MTTASYNVQIDLEQVCGKHPHLEANVCCNLPNWSNRHQVTEFRSLKFHPSRSVAQAVSNWSHFDWKREVSEITQADGSPFKDWRELRKCFQNLLSEGWQRVPVRDCNNFDKEKGCRGHEQQ